MQNPIDLKEFADELAREMIAEIMASCSADDINQIVEELKARLRTLQ
jgi:hypothetical protein